MKEGEAAKTPPFFIARQPEKFYAARRYEGTVRGPIGSL
jgi:hypothetical protein